MGPWVGTQGGAKGDQNFQNMPSLWRHLQKTPNENEKRFISMSTRRLAESVEGLNSSLALAAGDLWPKKGRPIAAVKRLKQYAIIIRSRLVTIHIRIHYHFSTFSEYCKCSIWRFDTNVINQKFWCVSHFFT